MKTLLRDHTGANVKPSHKIQQKTEIDPTEQCKDSRTVMQNDNSTWAATM